MTPRTALAQHRITRLASMPAVHKAFGWLHLHQPQLRAWQMEFLAIPAPPFNESARAGWFLDRFIALGLNKPYVDEAGNALAELPGQEPGGDVVLLSAHLDTVFPPGTPVVPTEDGTRIIGPGACDNGAGLAGLLAIVASLRHAGLMPRRTILFAANTGEEGEGDLQGMRHLFSAGRYQGRIAAALALEGAGTAATVTRALGSRRFRITVTGPGGHSWTDAEAPNPIMVLAQALARLAVHPDIHPASGRGLDSGAESESGRTTLSPGRIAGGTSINSIPASASVDLDLRSTEPALLDHMTLEIHRTFEHAVAQAGRQTSLHAAPTLHVAQIGNRPAAALPEDSPLLDTLRAVDRHLGLHTDLRLGSTDANIPLALGVPAAALAAGGTSHGIHTLAEWYDPTGRETALRRILLTLLDMARE